MSDHTRAAETELAALKEKQALQRNGEQFVVGPFGKLYPVKPFISQSYSFRDPKQFLFDPETMMKHHEPGYHYAWPKADDEETKAKIRQGLYIRVDISEVKDDTVAHVSTHKGTKGTEVRWYAHVLVKVPPKAWEELYEAPAAFSMTRLNQEVESFKDKVTSESRGVAKPTAEIGVDQGNQ